jgi:hypothetical protein
LLQGNRTFIKLVNIFMRTKTAEARKGVWDVSLREAGCEIWKEGRS